MDAKPLRCFIGIELSPESREAAARLIAALKKTDVDVAWVDPANLHLTLRFLGATPPEKIERIAEDLRSLGKTEKSFPLFLEGLGAFPTLEKPTVLWVDIKGEAQARLKTLASRIEAIAVEWGYTPETRPFSAHVTFGRVRSPRHLKELTAKLKESPFSVPSFTADHLTLFQSELTQSGSIYKILSRAPLF